MIERLVLPFPDRLAIGRSRREAERRAGGGMIGEAGEHGPLIVLIQVKEAVPGENSVEPAPEVQRAHVAQMPILVGKPLLAERQQARGRVQTGHPKAAPDQVAGNRLAAPAAEIEDFAAWANLIEESIDPLPFSQDRTPHLVPGSGVLGIKTDDAPT